MVKDVVLAFYTACSVFLMVYSVTQAVLLCRLGWAMLRRRVADVPPQPDFWPPVLVQLPIYNEKYVVARLLEAVAAFDYPRHQLTIQVLDDSTDDTAEVVASLVSQYRRRGLPIQHIRRPDRAGFKAGALAYGLDRAPHAEYVVIFDADFTPAPDVLRRLLPYFATHERVGFVQGRWGHLNAGDTWLTRAQALNIDAYYAVEQAARSSLGTVMSFNGTGGMWRVEAIRAAGGWQADTLTEDFDLSYRARLAGWRGVYAPDVVVAGELPPQLEAYKRQQRRWATGSTQVLFKLGWRLLTSRRPWTDKVLGLLQMSQYVPHPLMLVMLLLAPWLVINGGQHALTLAPLTVFALIQPLIHVCAQALLYRDWPRRLMAYPVVVLLSVGLLWNNASAVYEAYQGWRRGRDLEFIRTPKFGLHGGDWMARVYALSPTSAQMSVELGLAFYAVLAYGLAAYLAPNFAPWLLTYAIALGGVAVWGWLDQWRLRHLTTHTPPTPSLGAGD